MINIKWFTVIKPTSESKTEKKLTKNERKKEWKIVMHIYGHLFTVWSQWNASVCAYNFLLLNDRMRKNSSRSFDDVKNYLLLLLLLQKKDKFNGIRVQCNKQKSWNEPIVRLNSKGLHRMEKYSFMLFLSIIIITIALKFFNIMSVAQQEVKIV